MNKLLSGWLNFRILLLFARGSTLVQLPHCKATTCENFPQPCSWNIQIVIYRDDFYKCKQSSGRPLCVKGAGAVGDWGIVKSALSLIIYEQSLRVLLRKTHLPLHKGGFRFEYSSHRQTTIYKKKGNLYNESI